MIVRSGSILLSLGVLFATENANAAEHKVVTFVDGAKPSFRVEGARLVRGAIDLEVRLESINPLCYRYSVRVDGKPLSAPRSGAPALSPAPAAPAEPKTFTSVAEARQALDSASSNLETALREAETQASLEGIWVECEREGAGAEQLARVNSARDALSRNAAPMGPWSKAVAEAISAAQGGVALSSAAEKNDAVDKAIEAQQAAVTQAAAAADRAHEAARTARGARVKELTEAAARADEDTTRARQQLADLQARAANNAAMPALANDARRLLDRAHEGQQKLDALVREAARASALISAAPVMQTRLAPGTRAKVAIDRIRLEHGLIAQALPAESFESAEVEALSPIYVDVGIGPALTIGRNSEDYDLVIRNGQLVGARTKQELIVDGMVSFSAYIWEPRYLDDRGFSAEFLKPRPVLGLSITHPTTSIYAGLAIDPLQFVDISGGVRWSSVKTRIGWLNTSGDPTQPEKPATRDEVKPSGFVAITFSTDLFWRWLRRDVF